MTPQETAERYLDNRLPVSERKAFEARMRQDSKLAAEVAALREMRSFFAADRPDLEDKLSALGDQYFTPRRERSKIWPRLLPVLLLLVVAVVWRTRPTDTRQTAPDTLESTPPVIENPASVAPEVIPAPEPLPPTAENENPPPRPPVEAPSRQTPPIAAAYPARYLPNPTAESILREQVRADDYQTTVTSPPANAEFADSQPIITIAGTTDAVPPYRLIVYTNRSFDFENDYRSLDITPQVSRSGEDYTFSFQAKTDLEKGLYYWFLQREEDETLLKSGKFTVR